MKKRSSKEIFEETIIELSNNIPMNKITVKMIVEESGLSLQTFYNYYKDKAELVLSIHKNEGNKIMEKLDKEQISFREVIIENAKFYLKYKNFMLNAIKNTSGQDSYALLSADNAYNIFRRYLLKKRNIEKLPADIDFYLKMYTCSNVMMYAYWVENMEETSVEEFADLILEGMPKKLSDYILDIDSFPDPSKHWLIFKIINCYYTILTYSINIKIY